MEDMEDACKFFVGKHERKKLLDRLGCRWEDNIKTHFKE